MLMHKWISIFIINFVLLTAQQAEIDSLFMQANQAMDEQSYRQAVINYEKISQMGIDHPDLYYNLGNAYYRMGIYGQAVWAYEKGLQFTPRDPDLNFNLDLTNTRVRDRIEVPETFFLLEFYRSIKNMFTIQDAIFLGALFLIISALLFGLEKMKWLRIPFSSRIMGSFIILSVLVHGITLDKYLALSEVHEGIVVFREVEAFSAPFRREDAVLFRIHEGVKLEIKQKQSEWFEIVLLDGKKGWIQSKSVREL